AFITGDNDEGLFIINGRLNDDYSFEKAEAAIEQELEIIKTNSITEYELEKVKNKFESSFTFGLTSANEIALNLCQYELLGDAHMLNSVVNTYRQVAIADIEKVANAIFTRNNCSTLYYKSEKIK
ncbi:MAG TPA: insulinase family protein, partial [Bacteroidetes bacterium]|nr:insulinase family protein [Bacteroidota bacterium]